MTGALTFGAKRNDGWRDTYPVFAGGVTAGEIRRTRLGTVQGGGWGWTVACRFAPLATFPDVRGAKRYARERHAERAS